MNHNETANLFEKMREVLSLTDTQRGYDAKQWRACVNLWQGIFAGDDFAHVWAGVRMYIHNGGKWWPYPGEIADMMPACTWLEGDSLKTLAYRTRAQAKADEAIRARDHRLSPWSC